jgi:hypothetical protein
MEPFRIQNSDAGENQSSPDRIQESPMDVSKILEELRQEREQLEEAILSL